MSTVCEIQGFEGIENGHYLLVKGAPEVIGELFSKVEYYQRIRLIKKKPQDYDQRSSTLMKEGYRVLCLAYKKLKSLDMNLAREDAENELTFASLLVLSCPLKRDTGMYITQLSSANYKNIMITGDNMYTAAKTGQMLKFGPSDSLFLEKDSKGNYIWRDINDREHSKVDS